MFRISPFFEQNEFPKIDLSGKNGFSKITFQVGKNRKIFFLWGVKLYYDQTPKMHGNKSISSNMRAEAGNMRGFIWNKKAENFNFKSDFGFLWLSHL